MNDTVSPVGLKATLHALLADATSQNTTAGVAGIDKGRLPARVSQILTSYQAQHPRQKTSIDTATDVVYRELMKDADWKKYGGQAYVQRLVHNPALLRGPDAPKDYTIDCQETRDALMVTFTNKLTDPKLREVKVDGKSYTTVDFNGGIEIARYGFPSVKEVRCAFQTQKNANFEVVVKDVKYKELPLTAPWLPSKGVITRNEDPSKVPLRVAPDSKQDRFYPSADQSFLTPGSHFCIRDVRGFSMGITPVMVNTMQNKVRVVESIQFELRPKANDRAAVVNAVDTEEPTILRENLDLYKTIFPNFRWDHEISDSPGDLLLVCTARDREALKPYIEHKQSLGFKVNVREVATGTNAQSVIKEEYAKNKNTFYVMVVGDFEDVQSPVVSGNPQDNEMAKVAGDDNFLDLCLGRMSANSADDVKTQVSKIIAYEKDTTSAWKKQALGVGSDQGDGQGDDKEMDKTHIDVIGENKLTPAGYTKISKVYDPGATAAQVSSAVNGGVGLVNYCGHGSPTSWGTTGFSNSDVGKLKNGAMQPVILSVACVNGHYNAGTCFAEAWTRKKDGGAIATLMSTINQPWVPPMIGQDYIDDMLTGGYSYSTKPGDGIDTDHGKTRLGPAIFSGLNLMLAETQSKEAIDTANAWLLFGDPTLKVVNTPTDKRRG